MVDAMSEILIRLYEAPERPGNPMEFIKKGLKCPSENTMELLECEKELLLKEVKKLKKTEKDL
jgi:hypothetical protein